MTHRHKLASVFTFVSLLASTGEIHAQDTTSTDPHAVQPERPTVATHTGTVAPGWLEIEAGIELDKYESGTTDYPTPIHFKLGIGDRMQFGVLIPHIRWQSGLKFGDFATELKWRVAEDVPIVGDFALQPTIKFPTSYSTSNPSGGTFDVSLLLITSTTYEGVAIDLNAGYTLRTGDGSAAPKGAAIWTASFGGTVTGPLGWVAECFGYPGTRGAAGQAPSVGLLAGPTYLLHPWLAFDLGVIVPIVGPQPKALYAGVVWNVGQVFKE